MKIIIEQKDVGREFNLVSLAEILINTTTNDFWNNQSNIEAFTGDSTPEESVKMYGHNVIGKTPSGAKVSIIKNKKKPGPKKGSRIKKQDTIVPPVVEVKEPIKDAQ